VENDLAPLLETFFERSHDGFFVMGLEHPWQGEPVAAADLERLMASERIVKANPALAAQYRTTPERMIGLTPADLFGPDPEARRRLWSELLEAGHLHTVSETRRLDGSAMWVEGDYLGFRDDEGRLLGHLGFQRDVTDRTLAARELEDSRQELRALAARLQTAREEERSRIAREIHDELGQALTALKLDLAWLEQRLPSNTAELLRPSETPLTGRVDAMLDQVRRIATELRPSILDQLGLEAAIEWLVREWGRRTKVVVDLRTAELPGLPDQTASHAFRIIQEALTNITRHANAQRVEVVVRRDPVTLTIEVRDDGVGFVPQSLSGVRSLGIVGMRERAVACGGTLRIRGEPGKGTAIVVEIPLEAR
jgi:PAS domain S-box-containing protein